MKIENLLTEKNLKKTPQKITLLNMIKKSDHITFDNLLKNSNYFFSKSSLYRLLKVFENKEIIQKININNIEYYELYKKQHYHLVCIKCNKVFDYTNKIDINIDNFKIIKTDISISGICNNCLIKIN